MKTKRTTSTQTHCAQTTKWLINFICESANRCWTHDDWPQCPCTTSVINTIDVSRHHKYIYNGVDRDVPRHVYAYQKVSGKNTNGFYLLLIINTKKKQIFWLVFRWKLNCTFCVINWYIWAANVQMRRRNINIIKYIMLILKMFLKTNCEIWKEKCNLITLQCLLNVLEFLPQTKTLLYSLDRWTHFVTF